MARNTEFVFGGLASNPPGRILVFFTSHTSLSLLVCHGIVLPDLEPCELRTVYGCRSLCDRLTTLHLWTLGVFGTGYRFEVLLEFCRSSRIWDSPGRREAIRFKPKRPLCRTLVVDFEAITRVRGVKQMQGVKGEGKVTNT